MKKAGKRERTIQKRTKRSPLLDTQLRKAIQSEAKTLGLTPREYMNLAVGVAKNIRESFGNGQEKDAHQLLNMIQNPLFVILLRTVAESFLEKTSTDTTKEEQPHSEPAAPYTGQPERPQNRVRYEEMWDIW